MALPFAWVTNMFELMLTLSLIASMVSSGDAMNRKKYDFSKLLAAECFSLDEAKVVLSRFVSSRGLLHKNVRATFFVNKNNLMPLYQSALWHTGFLPSHFGMMIRLHCVWHNIRSLPSCPTCGQGIVKHQDSFQHGFNKYCSQRCSRLANHPHDFMSQSARQKMHRAIGDKRLGMKFPDKWKKNLRVAALKGDVQRKKHDTCLKRYGVGNPGVLGAYSSSAALRFIKNFLSENDIDKNRAFYKGGGVNGNEFFQMIEGKYVSYDLVVFRSAEDAQQKNLSAIEMVVEYNGPWHYLPSEVAHIGDRPASPYPASKTVRESVLFDEKKKARMLQFTADYRTYWDKAIIKRFGCAPEGIEVVP